MSEITGLLQYRYKLVWQSGARSWVYLDSRILISPSSTARSALNTLHLLIHFMFKKSSEDEERKRKSTVKLGQKHSESERDRKGRIREESCVGSIVSKCQDMESECQISNKRFFFSVEVCPKYCRVYLFSKTYLWLCLALVPRN